QVEIEGSEHGHLGFHLYHNVSRIVAQPDLGLTALGKQSLRLDHRLNDDGVERTRRHGDFLLPQHFHDDGIALGAEVAIERVRLANLERYRAHEIEKRAVIQWIGDAGHYWVPVLLHLGPLGPDVVVPFLLVVHLVNLLHEAARRERAGIEPALEHVVHLEHEEPAVDGEERMKRGVSLHRVDAHDLHVAASDFGAADRHRI